MSYDFYAEFWNEKYGANFNILRDRIPTPLVRAKLLKLAKNQTKAKNRHKEWIERMNFSEELNMVKNLGILTDLEVNKLPFYSAYIKINFKLKKPYISLDDEEFYILDNPVCKDKVFKVPYIRPSSWKGALRAVTRLDGYPKEGIIRLFGNEKGEGSEEERRRGRLFFFPTFLDKIRMDIIAPHDRETRTVEVPIQFEVAPKGAGGTFSLLYFPFDLIGKDEEKCKREVREDLEIVRESVKGLLSEYGFSAKRTSGYGVIEDRFEEGLLKTNFAGVMEFKDWNRFINVVNNVMEVLKNV